MPILSDEGAARTHEGWYLRGLSASQKHRGGRHAHLMHEMKLSMYGPFDAVVTYGSSFADTIGPNIW